MTSPPRPATASIARLIDSAWLTDEEMALRYVRFSIGCDAVGWLTPSFASELLSWPGVFERDPGGGIAMRTDGVVDPHALSATIALVIRSLADRGAIGGWRNELYPVRTGPHPSDRTLLSLERAAARAFGITSHAVHVNGISEIDGRPSLWIARRSPTKSIDPGMRDNMIGGGVPAGLSIRETLAKEAWEEAGLDAGIASTATDGRRLRIRRSVPEGVQSEVIFVHDLALPRGLAPANQDGEVASFELLEPDRVLDMIERGEHGRDPMTVDASLVTLDWLERNGMCTLPDTPKARAVYRTGGWS